MTNKIIALKSVGVFQQGKEILTDISLTIDSGELVYVIGKVGTGKTSLIKILNAELPLVKGEAEVLGFDLGSIRRKEIALLRKKMGVVFQDFRLLTDRNVYENLVFVLRSTGWKEKKTIDKRIDDVLSQVGMKDKITKMPHELSGGEQQRIVIARAILNSPELILADEPTGNLDPETSEEILQLFYKLNREGKTVVIVTHDYASISRKPARTLVCFNGKINDSSEDNNTIDFNKLLEMNW